MLRTLALGATLAATALGTLALTTSSGSAASSNPCLAPGARDQLSCSTLSTAKDGTSVLRVYAPKKYPIKGIQIETGTKTTAVRPASICKKHSTLDGSQYQEGTVYVTTCNEAIKPGHYAIYCFKGGGPIPSTTSATSYPVYVDEGDAGADNTKPLASSAPSPASVAKRKVSKH